MMKRFFLAWAAFVAMTSISFGSVAGVTLDYVQNPDPAAGMRSFTVRATGTGINVLGRFSVTGDVYQVWTAPGTQSEWLHDGHTPGDPKDSYVIFGDERIPDLPVTMPGSPQGPEATWETVPGGGAQGWGTLNNGVYLGAEEGAAGPREGFPLIVPGDANCDGLVNPNDLRIVALHWGCNTGGSFAQGDFNGDMMVDGADASILGANWTGNTESSAPEDQGNLLAMAVGSPENAASWGGGAFDGYLLLGSPSNTQTTVELLRLAVPDDAGVSVELEAYTCEYDPESAFYALATRYQFFGAGALQIPAPEPTTIGLVAAGIACLLWRRGGGRRSP
jgi:hypothetical protein